MKKYMTLLFFTCLFSLNTFCTNNKTTALSPILQHDSVSIEEKKDTLKKNIKPKAVNLTKQKEQPVFQDSIYNWVSKMYSEKKGELLTSKIQQIKNNNQIPKSYKIYWCSYLLYCQSIFYKTILKNDGKAEECILSAINELKNDAVTSDDYSLLAACTSFSIQFANMTQLASISEEVNELTSTALQLNNKNIRAYYVLASQNFYTPKMFGGGTKVEEYALQGLSCPDILSEDYYSPNWGRKLLLDILIKYYESENQIDKANQYKALIKQK